MAILEGLVLGELLAFCFLWPVLEADLRRQPHTEKEGRGRTEKEVGFSQRKRKEVGQNAECGKARR